MHRRDFLVQSALVPAAFAAWVEALQDDLWATASQILARVKPPEFPARDVDLLRHGAKGDGATDCSGAFRAAIAACHDAGGGRVVVPAGRFLTGAIRLRSNVNLHLSEGATIAFRPEAEAYLPLVLTRFEGVELMNSRPSSTPSTSATWRSPGAARSTARPARSSGGRGAPARRRRGPG